MFYCNQLAQNLMCQSLLNVILFQYVDSLQIINVSCFNTMETAIYDSMGKWSIAISLQSRGIRLKKYLFWIVYELFFSELWLSMFNFNVLLKRNCKWTTCLMLKQLLSGSKVYYFYRIYIFCFSAYSITLWWLYSLIKFTRFWNNYIPFFCTMKALCVIAKLPLLFSFTHFYNVTFFNFEEQLEEYSTLEDPIWAGIPFLYSHKVYMYSRQCRVICPNFTSALNYCHPS